ncbi:MAG TPA: prolyl aminopeptidase [bacterium]|nr:prolyl aminopeptidase [bacterium]
MRTLYPEINPFNTFQLPVSDLHTLHVEESGNPNGTPAVFLHGGPGGGLDPRMHRFFDPAAYRVILFDQRGCGASTPHAELTQNTTWDLVADIERIREHLGIDRWLVFGGSWGSTLALAYATKHPDPIRALVLRGIFLCRTKEIRWFYQEGASQIFPDYWEQYLAPIPETERYDLVAAYYKRLTDDEEAVRLEAARAWSTWEAATSKLFPDPTLIDLFEEPSKALALARIECHYFTNNCWFPNDNYLLDNVEAIRQIPGVIVQGRYDVVCPATSAWDLHRAWPEADLRIIPDAGHSQFEPGITAALVEATDGFR